MKLGFSERNLYAKKKLNDEPELYLLNILCTLFTAYNHAKALLEKNCYCKKNKLISLLFYFSCHSETIWHDKIILFTLVLSTEMGQTKKKNTKSNN